MWPNLQFPADLLTFTGEILNGKLHFLCSDLERKSHSKPLLCSCILGTYPLSLEATTILHLPQEMYNRRFSENMPTHLQKGLVVAAIIHRSVTLIHAFFCPYLMQLKDSKLYFRLPFYKPAERCLNLWNLVICVILIFLMKMHCAKNEVFIKDIFSKCGQIRRKLWIWSHLLEKLLMENFPFCAVM